ncbi:MAG: monovalent cation/H(+) antiporter subunit G [Gemmatimonadota bacterium]
MLAAALDLASWALLMTGALFCVIGGIGLLRLPEFFTRLHGAGLTDTLGAAFVLIGLMLQSSSPLVIVKLAMILAILWVTSPTSTHAIAKAARMAGLRAIDEQAAASEEGQA